MTERPLDPWMTSSRGPFLTLNAGGQLGGIVTITALPEQGAHLIVEAHWKTIHGEPRTVSAPPTTPRSIAAEEAPGGDRQRVVEVRPAEHRARQLGGQIGLAASAVGLLGTRARELCDQPARRGHDEERHQGDPVSVVGERQPSDRRQMEVVERERAEDRGREAEPDPSPGRDGDHADQVDDSERDDRSEMCER